MEDYQKKLDWTRSKVESLEKKIADVEWKKCKPKKRGLFEKVIDKVTYWKKRE